MGFNVKVVANPECCVISGIGSVLEDTNKYESIVIRDDKFIEIHSEKIQVKNPTTDDTQPTSSKESKKAENRNVVTNQIVVNKNANNITQKLTDINELVYILDKKEISRQVIYITV